LRNKPIHSPSKNISKIVNLISIEKGSGNITIENTEYGLVLNLSSSDSIILKAEKKFTRDSEQTENEGYIFTKLTTSQPNGNVIGLQDIFFYFNGLENNTLTIKFHCYTMRTHEKKILDRDEWRLELNEIKDGWRFFPINISDLPRD
jgi:hypothetical protein